MNISKALKIEQLKNIKHLYKTAFPLNERKPFSLMLKKQKEGFMEIMAIEENGVFLGLAITILYKDIALLDYFAIDQKQRGGGIGTKALKLLQKKYAGKRLLLEIESTKNNIGDMEEKLRRKSFYLKSGMCAMPYLVELFGVEMEILTYGCNVSFQEYYSIFENVFSPKIRNKVKLICDEIN